MTGDAQSPDPGGSTTTQRSRGLAQALAALRDNRSFRLLWVSNLFFFGGVWTQTLVLAWLAYETTGSPLLVAVFGAVRLSPLLLGPFAGVFADRHNRVRLLLLTGSWAVLAVGSVAALASLNLLPYWVLLLGGLAIGLSQSPSQPARASLVFELVSRENLSNANALNSMAINMTQVIGPALGGAMISFVGAPAALWISTAWYALSVVMLLPLRSHQQVVHARSGSAFAMVASGLRSIASNPLASATLLITLAANTFLWPVYQSFMPVFAKESLSLDAAGLGWLLACSGIGGLVGSVVIASLGDFRFKGGLFVVGTAVWGVLWALFALSHDVAASYLLMGAIGLASAAFGVLQTTLILMTTEPPLHGRALGAQELAIGVQPVASLALGAAAEFMGIGHTTFVSAVLLVVAVIIIGTRGPRLLHYRGIDAG
ncbi:MAG: MFS transporter [Arachnia sp.]